MTTQDLTTVHAEITVDVSQERAFQVFTEQFDAIKPREYNLLAVDIAETVLEPRVGGAVYDRGVDGSICRWARVLEFEPPTRFVISWDIGTTWRLETDLSHTSEVEIRFEPLSPDQARVTVDHRHLDRHGEGWEDSSTGLEGGWQAFLENFHNLV
ncbi:MAG TPA: SRPBCC family protein [Jiangellaceae bacterium]|nr:SRPBCC family protein [Jiangellaceae bacterium]